MSNLVVIMRSAPWRENHKQRRYCTNSDVFGFVDNATYLRTPVQRYVKKSNNPNYPKNIGHQQSLEPFLLPQKR